MNTIERHENSSEEIEDDEYLDPSKSYFFDNSAIFIEGLEKSDPFDLFDYFTGDRDSHNNMLPLEAPILLPRLISSRFKFSMKKMLDDDREYFSSRRIPDKCSICSKNVHAAEAVVCKFCREDELKTYHRSCLPADIDADNPICHKCKLQTCFCCRENFDKVVECQECGFCFHSECHPIVRPDELMSDSMIVCQFCRFDGGNEKIKKIHFRRKIKDIEIEAAKQVQKKLEKRVLANTSTPKYFKEFLNFPNFLAPRELDKDDRTIYLCTVKGKSPMSAIWIPRSRLLRTNQNLLRKFDEENTTDDSETDIPIECIERIESSFEEYFLADSKKGRKTGIIHSKVIKDKLNQLYIDTDDEEINNSINKNFDFNSFPMNLVPFMRQMSLIRRAEYLKCYNISPVSLFPRKIIGELEMCYVTLYGSNDYSSPSLVDISWLLPFAASQLEIYQNSFNQKNSINSAILNECLSCDSDNKYTFIDTPSNIDTKFSHFQLHSISFMINSIKNCESVVSYYKHSESIFRMIAVLCTAIFSTGTTSPCLIISENDSIKTWTDIFAKFAPMLNILSYTDINEDNINIIQDFEIRDFLRKKRFFNVILSTFDDIAYNFDKLSSVSYSALIVQDFLENSFKSEKIKQKIFSLKFSAKIFMSPQKLQFSLRNLYSVLNLMKVCMDDLKDEDEFVVSILDSCSKFSKKLRKYVLIEDDDIIPDMQHYLLPVSANSQQMKEISEFFSENLNRFEKIAKKEDFDDMNALIDDVRHILTCPRVIRPNNSSISSFLKIEQNSIFVDLILSLSNKMRVAVDTINMALKEKHSVVILVDFKETQDLLSFILEQRNIEHDSISGTPIDDEAANLFESGEISVLIVSTFLEEKNFNLACASIVIVLEHNREPSIVNKFVSFVHQKGQFRKVNVFHVFNENSVEKRILDAFLINKTSKIDENEKQPAKLKSSLEMLLGLLNDVKSYIGSLYSYISLKNENKLEITDLSTEMTSSVTSIESTTSDSVTGENDPESLKNEILQIIKFLKDNSDLNNPFKHQKKRLDDK